MQLMSWGANGRGQLGLGIKSEECPRPCPASRQEALFSTVDILNITGGASHSLISLKNGDVLGCGSNSAGQLGDTVERGSELVEFKKMTFLEGHRVTSVATKWDTSFAVDSHNRCVAWGPTVYGEYRATLRNEIPTLISDRVTQVACGLRHSLILTEGGDVLSAGDDKRGQLGRQFSEGFLQVTGLTGVKEIACGQYHNLALTSEKLFAWGCNKFGQLGSDPKLTQLAREPVEVKLPGVTGIRKIMCGWTHSCVLTDDGRLFNWGRNKYGQLGRDSGEIDFEPGGLDLIFEDVCVGSEHNLGITSDDNIFSWGWNEHGSCGLGHLNDVSVPTRPGIGRGFIIGAGSGQSFAVTH